MTEETKPKLSPAEKVKAESRYLRGTIAETLAGGATHFSGEESQLLKTHGTYQQDDRDLRQKLLAEKKEPAYSMMVRLKIPGGIMTSGQYLAYDEFANTYGSGHMRFTTRQGIQYHGVLKKNLKGLIAAVNKKLGTTQGACGDVVRNVMACPAPFADRKNAEIIQWAKKVSDQFLAKGGAYQELWLNGEKVSEIPENPEPIYGKTYLPRKFKIAIAFHDDNCTDIYSNDLGIAADMEGGKLKGFHIVVGGGFGSTHNVKDTYLRIATPLCYVKPEELLGVSKAIVMVQRDFGNRADRKRARMKYLIDSKGMDWFREEVEKHFGKKLEPHRPIHWQGIHNHLGWHEEGNGKWFLGLPVENGRVKDVDGVKFKSGLRAFVEKFHPANIFITAQQDVLFSGFQESQKKEAESLLKSYGIKLPQELSLVRKDAMACPALPTCGLAISESERVLPAVIDEIEKDIQKLGLGDQRIMIRMTGCPNGCARPYNVEIGLVGRSIGTYNINLGGNLIGDRLNHVYAEKVPLTGLAAALLPLFKIYKKERQAKEGFGDFCQRVGLEYLKKAAIEH